LKLFYNFKNYKKKFSKKMILKYIKSIIFLYYILKSSLKNNFELIILKKSIK
jgi:hypothetical protein